MTKPTLSSPTAGTMCLWLIWSIAASTELWALVHGILAATFAEGAYWLAMATYVAVAAVSWRQVANGHTLFTVRADASPESAP